MSVCAAQPDLGCVTTDESGRYTFPGLPRNTAVRFKVTKSGYLGDIVVIDVRDVDRDDINGALFEQSLMSSVFADAGITYDPSKGIVGWSLDQEGGMIGASGYTVSLAPSGGDGPFYASGFSVDPALTNTNEMGAALVINLENGDYVASAEGPGTCTPHFEKESAPMTWPAPVEAGFVTAIAAFCPDGGGGGAGGAGGAGAGGAGGGAGGS